MMLKTIYILLSILLFSGCDDTPQQNYDAKKLIKQKCSSCHNLDMPPTISKDELAPPMMAVAFHVYSFVKPSDESQREIKAQEFVVDYIKEPSFKKSFCDKESLKRYGLMPSQKNNLTDAEAKAIAIYMFKHFTQKNLMKIQQEKAAFQALPEGKKVALKYKCLGCHKAKRKIVGPSFQSIANKYKNSQQTMIHSIKNGTSKKWSNSNGAIMPSFKQITDKELKDLLQYILSIK